MRTKKICYNIRMPRKKSIAPKEQSVEESVPVARKSAPRISFILASIILVLGLLYLGRSLFVAAIVNGKPVSRLSVVKQLEKQNGARTLNSIISEILLAQEAKKKNVSVSPDEVKKEIETIEKNVVTQGQKLEDLLQVQGMTRTDLEKQIKVQKLAEKLLAKEIVVTDKEVEAHLAQSQPTEEGVPAEPVSEEAKKSAKEQLYQQKLSAKFQELLDRLQKEAKITKFVSY